MKRKAEKERMKMLLLAEQDQQQSSVVVGMKDLKKKKKRKHKSDDALAADNHFSDGPTPRHSRYEEDDDMGNMEYTTSLAAESMDEDDITKEEDDEGEEEEGVLATKEEFEQYKSDILKRVPKSVKSRFRQGGFSRWCKDWLPILELGPFDVEPGPVRDMWFDMLANVSANITLFPRLTLLYGSYWKFAHTSSLLQHLLEYLLSHSIIRPKRMDGI